MIEFRNYKYEVKDEWTISKAFREHRIDKDREDWGDASKGIKWWGCLIFRGNPSQEGGEISSYNTKILNALDIVEGHMLDCDYENQVIPNKFLTLSFEDKRTKEYKHIVFYSKP